MVFGGQAKELLQQPCFIAAQPTKIKDRSEIGAHLVDLFAFVWYIYIGLQVLLDGALQLHDGRALLLGGFG